MTRYDHDIDHTIISYLYKNEKANFSQILRHVEASRPRISRKVLSSHLKRLEEDKIIQRERARLGYPRFYKLTKLALQQKSLGIPVLAKSKRERRASVLDRGDIEDPGIRTKRMYQLLFFIASSGAGRLKPNPKPEPGDIGLYGADGKLSAYSYYKISGVGASDFSVRPVEIIGQAGALTDVVADLSPSEISSLFELLSSADKPKLIKPIDDIGGEIRYGIANEPLKEYISDCWVLFPFVRWRMEETWQYIRQPLSSDEVQWYEFFYGKVKSTSFFIRAHEIRKSSKADRRIKEHYTKHIRTLDDSIRHHLEGWRDEKGTTTRPGIYQKYGKNVMNEYKFPAKVLLDMVYPNFLRKLQKDKKI